MSANDIIAGSKVRFDRFNVDLSTGKLQRSGLNVPIQAQPFQVLRLLLIADGQVVSRDQLRAALWPKDTFGDFEHGLNTAVRKLRQALEDSAENPRFIETLPKLGYRFMASVEWAPEEPARKGNGFVAAENPAAPRPLIMPRRPVLQIASILAAILILAMAGLWFIRVNHFGRRLLAGVVHGNRIQERQPLSLVPNERPLTANPDETPVTSSVISPDGKYLAYTDVTGFYLREVDSGETHAIPLEKGFEPLAESWFPDHSHLVVSWTDDPQRQPSLWKVSVFGGPAQKLSDAGYGASVSPDGSQILYIRRTGAAEEVWLMAADGSRANRVLGSVEYSFGQIAWAPQGDRFAYAKTTDALLHHALRRRHADRYLRPSQSQHNRGAVRNRTRAPQGRSRCRVVAGRPLGLSPARTTPQPAGHKSLVGSSRPRDFAASRQHHAPNIRTRNRSATQHHCRWKADGASQTRAPGRHICRRHSKE